jgi:hypothetical protein
LHFHAIRLGSEKLCFNALGGFGGGNTEEQKILDLAYEWNRCGGAVAGLRPGAAGFWLYD